MMKQQKTATKAKDKALADLTLEEINTLSDEAATKLCVRHDLPLDVTPTIMRQQLEGLSLGGKPGAYVSSRTLCPTCRHLARRRGEILRLGNTIGRRMVCTGRNRHSFVAYAAK